LTSVRGTSHPSYSLWECAQRIGQPYLHSILCHAFPRVLHSRCRSNNVSQHLGCPCPSTPIPCMCPRGIRRLKRGVQRTDTQAEGPYAASHGFAERAGRPCPPAGSDVRRYRLSPPRPPWPTPLFARACLIDTERSSPQCCPLQSINGCLC